MTGKKVFVLGGANMDIQGKSAAAYAPRDSNPGRITRIPGGVGRNIAENLVRLGLEVELAAPIGRDPDGEALLADCGAKGIGTRHCPRSTAPTPAYLCLLDETGALVGAVADMEAMEEFGPWALETLRPFLAKADYIVADANLPAPSLAWLASTFGRGRRGGEGARASRGPRLYLDPVSQAKARRAAGLLAAFDCLKPNRAEAALLAGLGTGGTPPGPGEIAEALRRSGDHPGELYVSLGREGMFYSGPEGEGLVSLPQAAEDFPALSSSGAGDAACAALLWAESQGCAPRERAEFALAAAVLTAAELETVAPAMSPAELLRVRGLLFPKEARP